MNKKAQKHATDLARAYNEGFGAGKIDENSQLNEKIEIAIKALKAILSHSPVKSRLEKLCMEALEKIEN